MSETRDLIEQVLGLPEEQRQRVVAEVLASLHQGSAEVDKAWLELAEGRLEEIRSGRVQTLSAEEADARTRAKLATLRREP